MTRLVSVFYMIGLLLALPSRSWASSPLCELGTSIIDQMNLQVNANGKISPAVLTGSIAFVSECPASVMPAFKRFASDEQKLHESWIEALKSGTEMPAGSELRGFLAMAKESVERNGNVSLKKFLDGVLEVPGAGQKPHRLPVGRLYQQQSLATLKQFSQCDAAECNDVSDFLLFLLGAHPAVFFGAMHAGEPVATKWLAQLPNLSFAGEPSDRGRRDSIRRFLLKRISESKAPEFTREKSQCQNVLRDIRFRAWK